MFKNSSEKLSIISVFDYFNILKALQVKDSEDGSYDIKKPTSPLSPLIFQLNRVTFVKQFYVRSFSY